LNDTYRSFLPYLQASITIALKNISHGVVSHPDNFHDDSCDPFIAAINSMPVVKDKIKLHICNGILDHQGEVKYGGCSPILILIDLNTD
jgi:hypothetical protein